MTTNPNFGSTKFLITLLCVVAATVLAVFDKNIPEGVFVAAVAAYNAANAWVKVSRNGEGRGERV